MTLKLTHFLLPLLLQMTSLSICGTASLGVCRDAGTCSQPYIIILDAGSTGTRLHVYQFERDEHLKAHVQVLSEKSKSVGPGLASLAFSHQRIQGYLKPLIDFARTTVPEAWHSETMLFLGATAGVRLLPFAQKRAIVYATAAALRRTPFRVDYKNIESYTLAMVLSGAEEAGNSWLAVNLLLDKLEADSHETGTATDSYGILDLGGGSTQIAVEPAESALNSSGSNSTPAYRRGYLGLGKEAAELQMFGYDAASSASSTYESACLHPRFAANFTSGVVTIRVSGNPETTSQTRWRECLALTRVPLQRIPVERAPRAVNPIYMAVSGIYHVSKSLEQFGHLPLDIPGNVTVGDLASAAEKSCTDPPTKGKYEPYLCMDSAYIVALLKDGYQFADSQRLFIANSVNGFEPSWTLGLAYLYVKRFDIIGVLPLMGTGYFEGWEKGQP